MVLPMPSMAKAIRTDTKSYLRTGMSMAKAVMAKLTTTVFLRPILFISIPVGIERIKNHKKHDNEISPATVSSIPAKSALT